MRNLYIVVLSIFVATAVALSSCASTGKSSGDTNSRELQAMENNNLTLTDWLRRMNGVRVQGSGGAARISIRGSLKIADPYQPPLFVLNGQPIGRNYSSVYSMVPRGTILSVQVLKPSEAALYGQRGSAGVIVIKTE